MGESEHNEIWLLRYVATVMGFLCAKQLKLKF
jgi:hypothetical protein